MINSNGLLPLIAAEGGGCAWIEWCGPGSLHNDTRDLGLWRGGHCIQIPLGKRSLEWRPPPPYATGYGAADASHQDLTRRYIAELNKPRIRLPAIVGFVGAVGMGLVVGRVIP